MSDADIDAPSTMRILRRSMRADLMAQFARMWNISAAQMNSNPCPRPVALIRSSVDVMRTEPYVCTTTSGGKRYQLLLTRYEATKGTVAVLVSDSLEMFQVQVVAPRAVFGGSLFDGELVWCRAKKRMCYRVFDAVRVAGRGCWHLPFTERYGIMHKYFTSAHVDSGPERTSLARKGTIVWYDGGVFEPKRFFPARFFKQMVQSVKAGNHATDGFVFVPSNRPVARNRDDRQFRWKYMPTADLSYDGQVVSLSDGTTVQDAFPDLRVEILGIPSDAGFTFAAGCVLEFTVRTGEGQGIASADTGANTVVFVFYRVRDDRPTAHSRDRVHAVIEEAQYGVQVHELTEACDSIINNSA